MLNLIENDKELDFFFKNKNKLKFSDIKELYCPKADGEFLIGLEYERLSLDKNTYVNAEYKKLEITIKQFALEQNWELLFDSDVLIGAYDKNGTSVSLEPGCQLEISLAPKADISSIETEALKIIKLIDNIGFKNDVIFLGYGVSPVSSAETINLLQKRRYKIMNEYLPKCNFGELSQNMMRKTAGIQVNIDYFDENDLFLKLKFMNLISPFMMGLCSNSPFELNNLTSNKSNRAHIWRFTGRERCNLFYKSVFNKIYSKKNIIKNYIASVLDIPMIFIERKNKIIEINGKITFREFLKSGFNEFRATIDDYILHQSLCFPDVRLKKYIEIRNHDSSDINMALALCAFYKGLANCDLEKLLDEFNFIDVDSIDDLNEKIIKFGLDYKINNKISSWDIVSGLFKHSCQKLSTKERIYLKPILDMIKLRKTKADLIIEYGIENINDLIEFLY